jgi:hypothetical protein
MGEECDGARAGEGCDGECHVEVGFACEGEPSLCHDVDECESDPDVCGLGINCENQPGGYDCKGCRDGYLGNPEHGCEPTTTLSSFTEFSCALPVEGGVHCWGDDYSYQVRDAPATGDFRSVAAGLLHVCAIRADGSLTCWGENSSGQAPTPAPVGNFKSISCGSRHSCAVDLDGNAQCWGDADGKLTPPAGRYRRVVSGRDFACALTESLEVVCFGDTQSRVVQEVPRGKFVSLRAGSYDACVLDAAGQPTCWGEMGSGQTLVPPGHYSAIAIGEAHGCAIRAPASGYIDCWGDLRWEQGNTAPAYGGTWHRISAGMFHTCVLGKPAGEHGVDGTIYCFGRGFSGEAEWPAGIFKIE